MEWRLIIDERPRSGAENMAVDRLLMETVRAGGRPSLRFYRWAPPCLSLGRNQPFPGADVAAAAAARGIDLVRRPTGGQAVYHDREVTYSVAAPIAAIGSPRTAYRTINLALIAGLRRLGAPAEVAPEQGAVRRSGKGPERAPRQVAGPVPEQGPERHQRAGARGARATGVGPPAGSAARAPEWSVPCFAVAAPGEVVAGGRKLVGSAQRREGAVLLQHGSVLLEDDQGLAAALLGGGAADGGTAALPVRTVGAAAGDGAASSSYPAAASGVTSLDALLGAPPAWDAVVAALAAGFEEVLGVRLVPGALLADEASRIAAEAERFRSREWILRR